MRSYGTTNSTTYTAMRATEKFSGVEQATCDQNKRVKMAEYKDGEDINSFLEAFEGIMKLNEVEENDWLNFLVPSLTGKLMRH